MRTRRRVDPTLLDEVQRLQAVAEGLPPKPREKVRELAARVLFLDREARYGRPPFDDPWAWWGVRYFGITDVLGEAWDAAYRAAH